LDFNRNKSWDTVKKRIGGNGEETSGKRDGRGRKRREKTEK